MGFLQKMVEHGQQQASIRERVCPKGYVKLPAGILRQIRINRECLLKGTGKPYVIYEMTDDGEEKEIRASDIICVDGLVYFKHMPGSCFADGIAKVHAETSDEMFIKL